ncbi:MAG: 3-methyl-2-oxobutanoate hydroxymethyltransferase [Planctomycetota bacterium]|nr:MAG: 3-methyl-2-oxobutanoate hydroxymethyltransferase [Planctomycetota bacterium]
MKQRVTIRTLAEHKRAGRRFAMVTAYDAGQAALLERAGIEVILVGDSAGNVCHGQETTLPVTLDEMVMHTRWVVRGRERALVVADLPFLSYQTGVRDALLAAGRLMKEGGADAVKLEGGVAVAEQVRACVSAGIPVMGHVGLTPQSVKAFGGYRVQGRSREQARAVLADALALERAGAFAVVLECVPAALAALITARLGVPTIGIGAGAGTDGQVLVLHDLLGLSPEPAPRFVKRYAELGALAVEALQRYRTEVERGAFPTAEHAYATDPELTAQLQELGASLEHGEPAAP